MALCACSASRRLLVALDSGVRAGRASADHAGIAADLSRRADGRGCARCRRAPDRGTRTGTEGNAKARAVIADRLRAIGLEPLGDEPAATFGHFELTASTGAGYDVAAADESRRQHRRALPRHGRRRSGDGDQRALRPSRDVRDGAIYPGADDNASGVAMLLALAAHCRRDAVDARRDLRVVRRRGARAAGRAGVRRRPADSAIAHRDRTSTSTWSAAATSTSCSSRAPPIVPRSRPCSTRSRPGRRSSCSSATTPSPRRRAGRLDHAVGSRRVSRAGIPFLYFGVEDHPDYHKPTDTADKINPAFFLQAASTILDAVDALDRWLPPPRR